MVRTPSVLRRLGPRPRDGRAKLTIGLGFVVIGGCAPAAAPSTTSGPSASSAPTAPTAVGAPVDPAPSATSRAAPSASASTPACPPEAPYFCRNGGNPHCAVDEGACFPGVECRAPSDCRGHERCVNSSLGGAMGCTNDSCCGAAECSNGCASALDCPACRPVCEKPPGDAFGTCRSPRRP